MEALERFIEAQDRDYEHALRELKEGRKASHWIWYIFPQLADLGRSGTAKYYGIKNIQEARSYMAHSILGPRYVACVKALLKHKEEPIETIMGSEIDALKLRSSLTLMIAANERPELQEALDTFYGGSECEATNAFLNQET